MPVERTPSTLPSRFKLGQHVLAEGMPARVIAVVFRPERVFYDVLTSSGLQFYDVDSADVEET